MANELVGLASAHDDYGVVIDPSGSVVDEAATTWRRAELWAPRGWATPPVISR